MNGLPTSRRWRTLALISLASLGWAFSFGLGAPLASLHLKESGHSGWTLGANTSLYYLGVAIVSPIVPWLMRRNAKWCVLFGMLLDALTTALFPWVDGLPAWHSLRVLGGVGTALSLIPMETLVNHNAPDAHRARDFGIYAFCVAVGIALGAVVGLPLYPIGPKWAFAVGGLVTLLAMILAWIELPVVFRHEEEVGAAQLPWTAGVLSLGTAWAQGFLEGGMLTFLSIYLLSLGYSESGAGGLMGGLFTGVILAQLPLAWLADRIGRLRMLLICHGLLLVGLVTIPILHTPMPLTFWLFILGACCGALYPLGLAFLGERMPAAAMAKANAWYLASNCAGSLSGPIVIGIVVDWFGLQAQFLVGGIALMGVILTGVFATRVPDGQLPPIPGVAECRRVA